ncbi:hypothetical protein AAGF08_20330, partial [Algoriphagus sp. SE2]|uniref:hypothetical protein n=1 Tax=Algoriphagus sp. SE2 TaxID=3141536 RepID=UPI0031CCF66A
MRYLILALCFFLPLFSIAQSEEKIELTEYSFAEFFQMIEDESSDVFTLKNAVLKYDSLTDDRYVQTGEDFTNFKIRPQFDHTDTLRISKKLVLENILVNDYSVSGIDGLIFHHLLFEQEVTFKNCIWKIFHSTFLRPVRLEYSDAISLLHISYFGREFWPQTSFNNSTFKDGVFLITDNQNDHPINIQFYFEKCQIYPYQEDNYRSRFSMYLSTDKIFKVEINENIFYGSSDVYIDSQSGDDLIITKNNFHDNQVRIHLFNTTPFPILIIRENVFKRPVELALDELKQSNEIEWTDFSQGIYSFLAYNDLMYETAVNYGRDSVRYIFEDYFNHIRIEDKNSYRAEIALHGKLKDLYDDNHDVESANAVFITMKDIETQRLEYLYQESPSFDTYFKWKVNQFLKIFSAYGTEPSKAITFSVYVILVFGLIYLFFPNHWDSHGKDRILHRYQFFFKYLNKDAGMHDVYLDGKKDELAHYDGFKNFFIENGKTVPKFFLATALPLYRWSTASTRSASWFLSKIDIFKGKWADLPAPQRAAKTVLLTLAFAIA